MNTSTQPTSTQPARWSPRARVGFRFLFSYFVQYALASSHKTVLERLPLVGRRLQDILFAPYERASLWLAAHVFHLSGASIIAHGTGFGDRAVDWITAALMLLIAILATAIWSALDRRRTNYQTLFAWLRFLLRLSLGISMLWYASIKIFPIQIESPSLAVLNEPLGNTSPMTLLWTILGLSHGYERVCGIAELCGGILILYRRTALLGALLSAAVIANIVLFDTFFDVAVKLYATNLLLMCLVVIAPDMRALFRLFVSHTPAAPVSVWIPPAKQQHFRTATAVVEFLFLLSCLNPMRTSYRQFSLEQANERHPSPLTGQWHVEGAMLNAASHPLLTGDGQPMSDLFFEPSGRDTERAADDTLWTGGRYDTAPHTVQLLSPARDILAYTITQPDPTHLTLTPPASATGLYPEIHLVRVRIKLEHYRLYDRGFHWINEFGFEG